MGPYRHARGAKPRVCVDVTRAVMRGSGRLRVKVVYRPVGHIPFVLPTSSSLLDHDRAARTSRKARTGRTRLCSLPPSLLDLLRIAKLFHAPEVVAEAACSCDSAPPAAQLASLRLSEPAPKGGGSPQAAAPPQKNGSSKPASWLNAEWLSQVDWRPSSNGSAACPPPPASKNCPLQNQIEPGCH